MKLTIRAQLQTSAKKLKRGHMSTCSTIDHENLVLSGKNPFFIPDLEYKVRISVAEADRLKARNIRYRSNDELLTDMATTSSHGDHFREERVPHLENDLSDYDNLQYGVSRSAVLDSLEIAIRAVPAGERSFDKVLALAMTRMRYELGEFSYVNNLIIACDTLDQPGRTYIAPPPPNYDEEIWSWPKAFDQWTPTMSRGRDEATVSKFMALTNIKARATHAQQVAYVSFGKRDENPNRLVGVICNMQRHLTLEEEHAGEILATTKMTFSQLRQTVETVLAQHVVRLAMRPSDKPWEHKYRALLTVRRFNHDRYHLAGMLEASIAMDQGQLIAKGREPWGPLKDHLDRPLSYVWRPTLLLLRPAKKPCESRTATGFSHPFSTAPACQAEP